MESTASSHHGYISSKDDYLKRLRRIEGQAAVRTHVGLVLLLPAQAEHGQVEGATRASRPALGGEAVVYGQMNTRKHIGLPINNSARRRGHFAVVRRLDSV